MRITPGLVFLTWCAPAVAQDTSATPNTAGRISYGLETAIRSGHADRGFLISDRPVFQPVVWVSHREIEFSLWSNFALADATDGSRPDIAEAELTTKYKWNSVAIAPAARMYVYQDRVSRFSGRSLEAWLNLANDFGPFTLFLNHSVDLLDYRGGYFGEAGLESSGKVSRRLEIGGSLGGGWANSTFNQYWAGVAKSAFNRVNAEAWFTVYANPHVYIGPHLEFSSIVDREVRAGDLFRPTYLLLTLITGVEF